MTAQSDWLPMMIATGFDTPFTGAPGAVAPGGLPFGGGTGALVSHRVSWEDEGGAPYAFAHWACVDTFVYFAHACVSPPPAGWVDAAHRAGVRVGGGPESGTRHAGNTLQ